VRIINDKDFKYRESLEKVENQSGKSPSTDEKLK
jgi:hypothetical protein